MKRIRHTYIPIDERIALSRLKKSDIPILVKHINDPVIFNNTLSLPNPYLTSDGEEYLVQCKEFEHTYGFPNFWVIRYENQLAGGIGLIFNNNVESHKVELGYWIAEPFREKGLMTKVLDQLSAYLFEHFHFVRIEAHVFTENTASIRALEKAGFQKEGILRKAFKKGEVYKDSMLFARISEL